MAGVAGIVSPVATVAAVVLTGNHSVVDAALGAVVALTGLALSFRLTPKLVMASRADQRAWISTGTTDRDLVVADVDLGRQV